MRHHHKGKKLGRPFQPRMALLRSLLRSLILHERIQTTESKAKELKRVADRIFAKAKKQGLSSRRQVLAFLHNDALTTDKLFSLLSPRFDDEKQSGFVRIIKVGNRSGDNARIVQVELAY